MEKEYGKLTPEDFNALFLLLPQLDHERQVDCLLIYGCYLNDLIGRAREWNMDSFLNAIRIDPSVVAGPTASFFVNVFSVEGDKDFLKAVGGAMSGKTGRQANYLKKFRLLMQAARKASGNSAVSKR